MPSSTPIDDMPHKRGQKPDGSNAAKHVLAQEKSGVPHTCHPPAMSGTPATHVHDDIHKPRAMDGLVHIAVAHHDSEEARELQLPASKQASSGDTTLLCGSSSAHIHNVARPPTGSPGISSHQEALCHAWDISTRAPRLSEYIRHLPQSV